MSPAGSGWLVASNEDAHGRHILSGSVKCKQWLQIWNISGSVKRHQFLDDGVLWKWWRTIGIEFPCHGRMRHKQNQWYWRRHNLHTGLWTDNDIGICFIIAFIEFFKKLLDDVTFTEPFSRLSIVRLSWRNRSQNCVTFFSLDIF